ncbi:hypothetical protein [uncultured Acetobacteroides sp.]|uniref:hypothetical protein n=1 Tax=uncultured Acetobacteroides sp. TaxID=1760811 RepID=UPI0029F5165D|nr:hypothetical protein [uncultured Acetobacteroides sp.]
MKITRLLVALAALLALGSCAKDEASVVAPTLSGEFKSSKSYATVIEFSFSYYEENVDGKILEKGVLVGEDPTTQSVATYDSDTAKHREINVAVRNLKAQTTYYVRPFVKTEKGIVPAKGTYKVVTASEGKPVLLSGYARFDDSYNANLGGIVYSNGGVPIEEAGFILAGKTYKVDPANLKADTLWSEMVKEINVIAAYKFYAKNRYGSDTVSCFATFIDKKLPSYKYFTVSATRDKIIASCTFFGHGKFSGWSSWNYYVIDDKPTLVSEKSTNSPFVNDPSNPCVGSYRYKGFEYGPTICDVYYYEEKTRFKPNTTYYVRMAVDWYERDPSTNETVQKYLWTEEKTVVTPSEINLNSPVGSSLKQAHRAQHTR